MDAGWPRSSGVHLMVWPLHSRLAALQSELNDVAAVTVVGVSAVVFDGPASVWNGCAAIVVTHYMDEDECCNREKLTHIQFISV